MQDGKQLHESTPPDVAFFSFSATIDCWLFIKHRILSKPQIGTEESPEKFYTENITISIENAPDSIEMKIVSDANSNFPPYVA